MTGTFKIILSFDYRAQNMLKLIKFVSLFAKCYRNIKTPTNFQVTKARKIIKNIPLTFAKHDMLSKIVGWLVGARDGKILGF